MKFRNNSKEKKKIRIGTLKNPEWITIYPNQVVDIGEKKGLTHNLEKLNKEVYKPKVNKKQAETKVFSEDFESELRKIKGIGKATAEDILKVFKSKKELIENISEKMPFRDDVVKKLKDVYGRERL